MFYHPKFLKKHNFSRGYTLVEVVITLVLLSIVAGFAITRYNEVKEQAYIDAMMNDLRNYAIVQEGYFNRDDTDGYGNPPILKNEEEFVYSENVHTDHFFKGTGHWYLRVRHDKTDVKCELFFGRSTDITHTPNRILCPGNGQMGDVGVNVETNDNQFTVNAADAEYTATATQPNGAIIDFEVDVTKPDSATELLCRKNGAEEVSCGGDVPTDLAGEYTVTATASVAGASSNTQTLLDGALSADGDLYDQAQTTYEVANTAPTADFTYSPSTPQTQEGVNFDASASSDSDGWIINYLWDFGDGNTGTGEQPTHTYSDNGNYPVSLQVVDNLGDTTQVQKTVSILNQSPQATFDYTPSSPSTADPVNFDASASSDPDGSISSYSWDYNEDGNPDDSGATPTHTFADDGIYAVELTVQDDDGTTSTFTDNVIVQNQAPNAQFTYSPDSLVASEPVSFDGTASSDPDGSISSYSWDFGDGGSGSGQTPAHTYAASGTYTTTLTVIDDDGTSHSTSQTLEVDNAAPTADFTWTPESPSTADEVSLKADGSSDPDGSISSYSWDLDDDGTQDQTGLNITHTFPDDGIYPVSLTVTDNQGRSVSVEKNVDVSNQLPSASFTYTPDTPETLTDVSFDGSGSSDPDGSISSYSWDFGDGNTATGESVQHSYADNGTYTVELTVVDNDSGSNTTSQTITVQNQGPVAEFTWMPTNPRPDSTITFDGANSFDADGTLTSFSWDFNNDGTQDATGSSPTHTFTDSGDYPVSLTVTDDDGATNSTTQTVSVVNSSPSVSLSCDDPALTNQTVTCTATASDPDGDPLSYTWGGSFTGTSSQESRSFSDDGSYSVSVTVDDGNGGTASDNGTVVINNRPPNPDIAFSPSAPGVNESITFDGSGSSDPDGSIADSDHSWDFNNDGVADATGATATHAFSSSGSHTVVLTVTDDDGATSSTDTTVSVSNSSPVASITCDDPKLTGETITCDASGSSDPDGDSLSYTWSEDFSGTGATSSRSFSDNGTYTATVTVSDGQGGSSTVSASVEVHNRPPTASFTYSPSSPSVGETVSFDGSDSSDPDGSIVSYSWDFNNDGVEDATGATPSTSFGSSGSHTVSLTVTDDDGATHTTSQTISVANSSPTIDSFSCDDPKLTFNTITCSVSASDPDGDNLTYSWGGAFSGNGSSQSESFSDDGRYPVSVTVSDGNGGSASTSDSVTVNNRPPQGEIAFTPSSPYVGDPIDFDGSGSSDSDGSINSYSWDFNNDGTTDATGSTATHTYSTEGTHTVVLTVVDDDGASSSVDTTITIGNTPPLADVVCDDPALTNQTITCDASGSSDPDGESLTYSWSGDFSGTGVTSDESFSDNGTYTATVTVTDPQGASDQASESVTVNNRPPNAFFSVSCTDLTCDFTDQSSDSDGFIQSWSWDFGDGATSTAQNPSHTYSSGDTYTITLTVTDDDNATDSYSTSVSVTEPESPPLADFTYSPSSNLTTDDNITFDGSEPDYSFDSDGSITSYDWNFDDGATSTGATPSHTYSSAGTYDVRLVVTDDDGLTDDTIKTIDIAGAYSCDWSKNVISTHPSTSDPDDWELHVYSNVSNAPDAGVSPNIAVTATEECGGDTFCTFTSVSITGSSGADSWDRTEATGSNCGTGSSSASGTGDPDGVNIASSTQTSNLSESNKCDGNTLNVHLPTIPTDGSSYSITYTITDGTYEAEHTISCSTQ